MGPGRSARGGWFQSEPAGGGSGDAYGTAAIARMCDGENARSNGRARAAGRTSRRMREIPRISGRTEQPRLGGRHQSEFRTGGFSEDREAGIEEAPGEGAGMIRDIVLVDAGARRRPRALENIQILQQKRHAGKRPFRKPLVDLLPGIVVM